MFPKRAHAARSQWHRLFLGERQGLSLCTDEDWLMGHLAVVFAQPRTNYTDAESISIGISPANPNVDNPRYDNKEQSQRPVSRAISRCRCPSVDSKSRDKEDKSRKARGAQGKIVFRNIASFAAEDRGAINLSRIEIAATLEWPESTRGALKYAALPAKVALNRFESVLGVGEGPRDPPRHAALSSPSRTIYCSGAWIQQAANNGSRRNSINTPLAGLPRRARGKPRSRALVSSEETAGRAADSISPR
ncbi:hypothetical protein KM043_012566 [Ampulex compressa]|nr:hypothetical protein KM043_012566 [Ampulex compressa]